MALDDERQSPAWLGTLRERLIKQFTGNPNFYSDLKQQANHAAMKLLPQVQKQIDIEDSKEARFRVACLAAVAANAMELDVVGHEFSLSQLQNLLSKAEETEKPARSLPFILASSSAISGRSSAAIKAICCRAASLNL